MPDPHSTSRTILIVEDSDQDFETISRVFASKGFRERILRFSDGDLFRDWVESHPELRRHVALIWLDLRLPGISGSDLLKYIRDVQPFGAVPVIVFSSSEKSTDVRLCYDRGANSYHVKPFLLRDFRGEVEKMIDYWLESAKLPA